MFALRVSLCSFLVACSAAPERYKATRLGASDATQAERIKEVELQFAGGGADYDTAVAACLNDAALAQKLSMLMVVHMKDAEARQRRAMGTDFQLRSLDENVPYSRARATLSRLGSKAVPTIDELVRHPRTENRMLGVAILAAMPPDDVLPAIHRSLAASAPKYRRHYVEAVAQMQPDPAVEKALLGWSTDADYTIRAAALAGLTRFGDRHLPMLRRVVIEDPDAFVKRQIVRQFAPAPAVTSIDPQTASAVVQFYAGAVERGDRLGIREAERTLVKMAKLPVGRGKQVVHYGLAYWQKWVQTLPADGGRQESRQERSDGEPDKNPDHKPYNKREN